MAETRTNPPTAEQWKLTTDLRRKLVERFKEYVVAADEAKAARKAADKAQTALNDNLAELCEPDLFNAAEE